MLLCMYPALNIKLPSSHGSYDLDIQDLNQALLVHKLENIADLFSICLEMQALCAFDKTFMLCEARCRWNGAFDKPLRESLCAFFLPSSFETAQQSMNIVVHF